MSDCIFLDYTLEQFKNLELKMPGEGKEFNSVIIVPMDYIHDSGYRCMKYILGDFSGDNYELVGVIGGGSDVLHINGIGGYGLSFNRNMENGTVPVADWSIDCLDPSGCLRLFGPKMVVLGDIHCCLSSVEIYDAKS